MRLVTVCALLALFLFLAIGLSGCLDGCVQRHDSDPGDMGPPSPTAEAAWVRGLLAPLVRLTPRSEYGRLAHAGVLMRDADFTADNVVDSLAQRLDVLGAQLAQERGAKTPIDLLPEPADRQRALRIPFRGNPSDVKVVPVKSGDTKLYLPLGGDVSAPGNEVAVVSSSGVSRIRVGVHPQRLAVHPAGLVFVCNQHSNYVSILDAETDDLLRQLGQPVEIKTEYDCADLILVPKAPNDPDHQWLYVANRQRHSVLKYPADVVRDASGAIVGVSQGASIAPVTEIVGVGHNPFRLALSPGKDRLYVANNKGGELAWIDLATDTVGRKIALNAPSVDVLVVNDLLLVPTTMPDRGLLASDQAHPPDVLAAPVTVKGLDGQPHQVHPGALFDHTRSYGFEDVRNGIDQLGLDLAGEPVYYTDDVSPEANFGAAQKVLAGALPQAIARDAAGSYVYVALGGSDLVQELVVGGERPFALIPTRTFATGQRPFALAVDDVNHRLVVADWGGETVEQFDLASGARISVIGLGYSQPAYPATTIERGEYFFYNASWSNNGRKSCANCHFDELDTDGVGFSNGAAAPTALHQVKPNHNLATTHGYFWNGSFVDGDYTSLAFAAQTRTNCEVVELGLVEGPASDPGTRIGDPRNVYTNGQDASCRPISLGGGLLANQATIAQVVVAEKAVREATIQRLTGLDTRALSRAIDFYSVAELRLPPNPIAQRYALGQLDAATRAELDHGRQLFTQAGCVGCHDPTHPTHPFSDGLDHGSGADWMKRFVDTYLNDARIIGALGTLPQPMLDAVGNPHVDHELTVHVDALDSFTPFCFELSNCLQFEDPLAVTNNPDEESRRLDLLVRVNLADPDRGFIPGNVRGQPRINTPSLRGVWTQANLLHHGLARSVAEVVLAPGHPGLEPGESGFAVDQKGAFDVHGVTSALSPADVRALVRYVESIE